MEASAEFRELGRYFIQDLDLVASNQEEAYKFVLKRFKEPERTRLRDFIDHALRHASDEELQRLWNSVDADIYFKTAQGLRDMLQGARDRL